MFTEYTPDSRMQLTYNAPDPYKENMKNAQLQDLFQAINASAPPPWGKAGAGARCVNLVIDAQRDFYDPQNGAGGNADTAAVAQRIAAHKARCDAINIPSLLVFYSQSGYDHRLSFGGLDPRLLAGKGGLLVPKTANSAFEGRPLQASLLHTVLQDLGVQKIMVSGFNAAACVLGTLSDAKKLGYTALAVTDCIGSNAENAAFHDWAFAQMKIRAIPATTSAQIAEKMPEPAPSGDTPLTPPQPPQL